MSSDPANLWYWMNERHRIYLLRREGNPAPWTADQILRDYRFCNLFRELDKVTVWVRKNIREPYADHPNLWFMLAIARTYNLPSTLQALKDVCWPTETWDPDLATAVCEDLQKRGLPLHTGAYMIRAESDSRREWYSRTKAYYLNHIVLGRLWENRAWLVEELSTSLERATQALRNFHGWGGFMAYEVVTDLRWTRYLEKASDIYTWANPGPGANRGLNRYHGRPLKLRLKDSVLVEEMRDLLAIANGPESLLQVHVPRPLEMRDIEHSLCEFDKYERTRLGEGRPRSKYQGGVG